MATARQLAILDGVAVTAHPFCESPGRRPSQRTTVQELVYREPPILDRVSKEDRHPREELPTVALRRVAGKTFSHPVRMPHTEGAVALA